MRHIRELLSQCTGFEWDAANLYKNWIKHKVNYREIEQTIINRPAVFLEDSKHSHREERFSALGRTDVNRCQAWSLALSVVFTIRRDLIRPISARDMDIEIMGDLRRNEIIL